MTKYWHGFVYKNCCDNCSHVWLNFHQTFRNIKACMYVCNVGLESSHSFLKEVWSLNKIGRLLTLLLSFPQLPLPKDTAPLSGHVPPVRCFISKLCGLLLSTWNLNYVVSVLPRLNHRRKCSVPYPIFFIQAFEFICINKIDGLLRPMSNLNE